ncbi:hypothetical protein [Nocardia jejuensis]|uniref:hypothetical protein n=1 Tax=Nocardia jejuensis TaxID=328049 RepID=UPI00083361B8|nr:hypothetical protein [Nocardia jejuensis]
MANTLNVLWDRIWQRRALVVAIALVAMLGAYLSAHGRGVTYTSRVLVSAGSTRPPTQDAILAQGFTYYLNDPTYQAAIGRKSGFPEDIYSFSAQFVSASPLFYVQVTAATPAAAEAAAPKVAQLYVEDVNGRLDESRKATADAMTAAMMAVWGDRLRADDPNAFSAQIQLQQQIDALNADSANRLTILQSGAGAAANGTGKTRTLATGMVGGVLLGCVVAIMAGAATRRLYTDYDVVEKTGVRTLDVVPPGGTPARDARRQVVLRHISNLVAKAGTTSPTSVAVAPISQGVAAQRLARAIAEHRAGQGAKVLFVDADLRGSEAAVAASGTPEQDSAGQDSAGQDKAAQGAAGPNAAARETAGRGESGFAAGRVEPGLAELLRGSVSDLRAVTSDRGPDGFAEIAPGAFTGDPYALFDRDRFRAFLHEAGSAADLIVIQVPPIGTASESQIVTDLTDLTVLVIERGRTRVREVQEAVRAVNQVGAEVLGAVLVDTSEPRESRRRFGFRS